MKTAIIVIDTGFSHESIAGADQVLAVIDLINGQNAVGQPFVAWEQLMRFGHDPAKHGSMVLQRLRALIPDAPLVLVRAATEDRIVRTRWHDGKIAAPGWTEAYQQAVWICRSRQLASVANCSFGGFPHAMDGTGWEAHRLAEIAGDQGGHLLVAAAGPGDGAAIHASGLVRAGTSVRFDAVQQQSSDYNLWIEGGNAWELILTSDNGRLLGWHHGPDVPANLWNGKQQLTFTVSCCGRIWFELRALPHAASELRFHGWVIGDDSSFCRWIDPNILPEPAIFPHVIAVGLQDGRYKPGQEERGEKPDVLLRGAGPISFRTPEVTAAVAAVLEGEPGLDTDKVRAVLYSKHSGKLW